MVTLGVLFVSYTNNTERENHYKPLQPQFKYELFHILHITNNTVAKVSACVGNIAESMTSEGNCVPLDVCHSHTHKHTHTLY